MAALLQEGLAVQLQRSALQDPSVFGTLNGVRGLAAVAVALYHMHSLFKVQFVQSGYLAVDLFFVLSGVVIAHAYGARLSSGMTPLRFLRARFIRLAPLYLLGTAIGLVSDLALPLQFHAERLCPTGEQLQHRLALHA